MNLDSTDPMVLMISGEYYPPPPPDHDDHAYNTTLHHQFVPEQQGEVAGGGKARRRRRKKEGGEGAMRKRKLSDAQVSMLEQSFGSEHKLESERKDRLAAELGLDPRQVAVWFQNRRARWKTKKLEVEYSKLKSDHDNAILDKCRLHTEVLKLKEQLDEAEKKIKRLSERSDGFSSNSPTSSSNFSMVDPPFLGDFGMEGLENVICMPDDDDNNNNFYDQWGTLNYNYM